MSSGDITGLVAVVLIFGGPLIGSLVALIVNGWIKTARHREETELKHRLVDADFTADEIERILNAGPAKRAKLKRRRSRNRMMGRRFESADLIFGSTDSVHAAAVISSVPIREIRGSPFRFAGRRPCV
jgi:divalent metal cation (Fe/Co/Zn/Cd) transporter